MKYRTLDPLTDFHAGRKTKLPTGMIPGKVTPKGGDDTQIPAQQGEYIFSVDAVMGAGKRALDQIQTGLKQEMGNNIPPRNAEGSISELPPGMAEGGGVIDRLKSFIGVGPNPRPPLVDLSSMARTSQPAKPENGSKPIGIQKLNPFNPVIKALEGAKIRAGYEQGGGVDDDPNKKKVDEGQLALEGLVSASQVGPRPDPNQGIASMPVIPNVPSSQIVNSDTPQDTTEGKVIDGRTYFPSAFGDLRDNFNMTPELNAENKVRPFMQSVSDTPGGSRTIQIARPDATGNMPAVTMPNGGYIEPGLKPEDFGRRAGEENALFSQTRYDKHGNAVGPDTQGIAKEVNERTKRENELQKSILQAQTAEEKTKAQAALESFREDRRDSRQMRGLKAIADRAGGGAGTSHLPANLGPQGADGKVSGALEGLDKGTEAVVKNLVEYKIPLPSGFALKSPYWQNILERASLYDPTFDATQYNVRLKVKNDFNSGKAAQNRLGLNTAVGHIDSLVKASKELANTDWSSANKVENVLSKYFPVTPGLVKRQGTVTAIKTKFNAVKGEMASIFKKNGATDQEIKSWNDTIDDPAAATPTMWKRFVDSSLELMGSRIGALTSQYETGMGKPKDFKLLDPKSRTILKKLGVDVDALDPVASGGKPVATPTGIDTSQPHRNKKTGVTGYLQEDGSYVDAAGKRLD